MLRADGFTPLFFARDRATAKLLVDEGADVGFNRNNCAYQLFCRFLLTLAAANTPAGPRQPALTCLLAVGWSPLHYAAHHNMIALTEVLLENGADVHSKTGGACVLPGQRLVAQRTRHVCPGAHGGLEAMTFAARNENIFVARALIKHGADPHLPVDGGVPAAFPQDVAFADLMKVPGQGLRRWNECRVRRSCTHVLRSTGSGADSRVCRPGCEPCEARD